MRKPIVVFSKLLCSLERTFPSICGLINRTSNLISVCTASRIDSIAAASRFPGSRLWFYLKQGNFRRAACEFKHKKILSHIFFKITPNEELKKIKRFFNFAKRSYWLIYYFLAEQPLNTSLFMILKPLSIDFCGLWRNLAWIETASDCCLMQFTEFYFNIMLNYPPFVCSYRQSRYETRSVARVTRVKAGKMIKWKLCCSHQGLCCWS